MKASDALALAPLTRGPAVTAPCREVAPEFRFAGDPEAWAVDYGGFVSHQESEFEKTTVGRIAPSAHVGPLPPPTPADSPTCR